MRQNRPLPEKTGPRLSFVCRIAIRSDPVVVTIHIIWVRFILMLLLECFDSLSGHRHNYPRSVELREMVGAVVVGACHRLRPVPPSRKLPHCLVLVFEAAVISQILVTFFDLLWTQSVIPVETSFVPCPHCTQLCRRTFHVLRSSL